MKLLDLLNEQPVLNVQVTKDKNLNIISSDFPQGLKYKLQIDKGLMGWLDVNVDKVEQKGNTYMISASFGPINRTDVVPTDTLLSIKNNLGQKKISLGGKTPKRIVKI